MNFPTRLVYWGRSRILGFPARLMLRLLGTQFPRQVRVGQGFRLLHGGMGSVLHHEVQIGENVTMYHGVTLGRADGYKPAAESKFKGIIVHDGAVICAGAIILGKEGWLVIGQNALIAAGAVVLKSVGENEIWAGVPARCIGVRDDIIKA
jgi:serine O-acetyltransferase